MTEAAEHVGYKGYQNLCDAFCRMTGFMPSEIRASPEPEFFEVHRAKLALSAAPPRLPED